MTYIRYMFTGTKKRSLKYVYNLNQIRTSINIRPKTYKLIYYSNMPMLICWLDDSTKISEFFCRISEILSISNLSTIYLMFIKKVHKKVHGHHNLDHHQPPQLYLIRILWELCCKFFSWVKKKSFKIPKFYVQYKAT